LRAFNSVRKTLFVRQALPHRQLLPACLCRAARVRRQKIQRFRGGYIWPTACEEVFRFNIGLPFVRASATSRISTAHAAHQPQSAAASANKADDTSPFAMLLATGAAKDVKDQKSPAQDKDSDADKGGQDDTSASATKTASSDTTQTPSARSDTNPTKAEKACDDTKADDATPSAAADQSAADAPSIAVMLAQATQTPIPVAATAAANDDGDDTIEAAGAARASGQADAPANTQPGAQANSGTDAADLEQAQAPTPGAQAKPSAASTKPDLVKGAGPKAAAKTADTNTDAAKAATQADANAAANAPAPAADKSAARTDNAMPAPAAVTGADQTGAPAAPAVTQHVQVTAQPQPNLPALAVEIAAKSQAGSKQFDIRLDPPELGRVEVRLSIDATGKASAHLTAEQPQTLDLLQKDSTNLTRALRDAGLDVSQDGLNFSLRQHAGDAHQGQNNGGRSFGRGQMLAASTSLDATQASAAYRAPANGRLDIKV
jgi:chemotaxis protein MotD